MPAGLRLLPLIAALLAPAPASAVSSIILARETEPFRIGMLAGQGGERGVMGLERLREAFSTALGRRVEILVAKDFPSMIEAQIAGRLDYAVYSAMAYALAWRMCECVEPLAAPVSSDGERGMVAALFVRTDALRGAETRPLVPPDAPLLAGLLKAGQRQAQPIPQQAEAAEAAFVAGEASAYLGWLPIGDAIRPDGGTAARLAAAGARFSTVWTSPPVRFGPHAVRTDLPAADRSRLLFLLKGLHESDPIAYEAIEQVLSGGFQPAAQADYQAVIDLLPPGQTAEQVADTAEP